MAPFPLESRSVAAFDFDGTMVPGDSLLGFIRRAAGRRRFWVSIIRHGPRVALATVAHVGSRDGAKAAFLRTALQGLGADEAAAEGESFAADLHGRIRPSTLERLRWHQSQGHAVVIVSASLGTYLDPLGRLLGVDAVLATRLEVGAGGRLTGELAAANVRGHEKVRQLRRWLPPGATELWAYGDSEGDRELLAEADHSFLLRRGRFSAVIAG